MRCPFCNDPGNRVVDSRLTREGHEIRRRRECDECGRRFTTRERIDDVLPKLIKRDARREEYQRDKLCQGVQKACVKRPVSENAVLRLVDRVERRLAETGEAEVPTALLGDLVLEELGGVDSLAAARFASVFRDFKSADDYDAYFSTLAAESPDDEAAGDAPDPRRPVS
jgi:transcriptional repressor NrdR